MDKLIVSGLRKSFGSKQVLEDVNFTVGDGEFLSILGPSGCGKTTILRLLIGLETPEAGSILKDGREITRLPCSQRGMGMVFQNYALFENMTVLDNVAYAMRKRPDMRKRAAETAMDMLRVMGLEEYASRRPGRLSGGQQQRVALARTLALRPDVILFDEPMSALDVDTRLALRIELKELQRKFGSTMVYITHDQEEAFSMSDRIMVMDGGAVQQIDTPMNLVDHPATPFVSSFVCHNLQLKINALLPYARRGA